MLKGRSIGRKSHRRSQALIFISSHFHRKLLLVFIRRLEAPLLALESRDTLIMHTQEEGKGARALGEDEEGEVPLSKVSHLTHPS